MKSLILFYLFLLTVGLGQILGEKIRYDNYTLYRVIPKTKEAVDTLKLLEKNAYYSGYNFFTEVATEKSPVDILVPPKQIKDFSKTVLKSPEVDSFLRHENFQEAIDAEGLRRESRALTFGWTDYYTYDDINNWLKETASKYSDIATLVVGGKSYEGREILGLKLQFGASPAAQSVMMESNIHAREWISHAVTTYILNELLTSTDSDLRELAEAYDWYFFPIANPDGFVYTHTDDRLWRKTRTPYGNCFGADPNRNWPYEWNQGGASDDPCNDVYAGPSALSEACTSSLYQFIESIGSNLVAYFAFHSYAQLLLLPYGHTTEHLDNYDEMIEVGKTAISELSKRYGTEYGVGDVAEAIYVAAGGSMDTVKHEFHTPIVYTYELRDLGQYGFLLPADQIIPTALETLDSIKSIFKSYRANH